MITDTRRWRCRGCGQTLTREQCATRSGILECGACLRAHQAVGLLEPLTSAADVEALARLHAAAPDLLAACKAVLLTRACDTETRDQLRSAIARAEGHAA